MALSNSVYGSVATPRIYVDYIQYAKAIGYVEDYFTSDNILGDERAAFDMNPVNIQQYELTQDDWNITNQIRFKNHTNDDRQFATLLQTTNYYGLLGHRLAVDTSNHDHVGMIAASSDPNYNYYDWTVGGHSGILGDPDANASVGYSLYSIDTPISLSNASRFSFTIYKGTDASNLGYAVGDVVRVGSWTAGRYFDFPHSANLQMNINHSFDGVKSKRTAGGSDITEILYTKPNWGDLPAWEHIDTSDYDSPAEYVINENYSNVTNRARRSWDLTFSFLAKDDTFPKSPDGTIIGEYLQSVGQTDTPIFGTKIKDNIVSSLNALTLGGQIPFIFQPDKTKKDICMCKLRSNGLSIQQTAPQLFTCQLKFVEVW